MKKTASFIFLLCMAVNSYGQIGDFLKNEGLKFAKKEGVKILSDELSKTKAKFDSASFSYAVSLSDKAAQFESKDKLADVVTVSSMLVNKEKDKSPIEVAQEYMDVGEMAYSANGFKVAEGSFLAANAILIAEGAQSHPLYGRGLANLGLLYNGMGRYAAAEELTKEALTIREKYFGRDSKDYAASLNNLAVLNKDLGNYNESEKEITEAIALNKSVVGNESIAYAISLNNRGVLYQTLGRYEDAELDMLLALDVALNEMKPGSLQYTRFQANLALLYQQQGKYTEAEKIYLDAISAIAKNPGTSKKTNPDYAHMIENLALLYVTMDRSDNAEELFTEALAVYERKFGDDYSGYGLTSARLGTLYLRKNDLAGASKYLNSAEKILSSTYGEQHPTTVDTQIQLGILMWKQDKIIDANDKLVGALDQSLEFIGQYFAPMSDTEKAMYWQTLRPRFDAYYAFTADKGYDEILDQATSYRITTKAMLLSGTTKVKNQILNSGDDKLIKDYQTWLDQKGTLAHYYEMSKEDLDDQEINLDSITRATNDLEKSLSERSGLFTKAYQSTTPTLGEVQDELKTGEAAVEIIRFDKGIQNDLGYLALIVLPDRIEKVSLKNGEDLEGMFYKRYRNLIKYKKEDLFSYNEFWQPIDEVLGSTELAYISLDGIYNQISIGSLLVQNDEFTVDRRQYTVISSLRNLIDIGQPKGALKKQGTLFGNPIYGSSSIDPLPGTGQEVEVIENLLNSAGYKTTKLIADQASEQSLKDGSKKGILHIATHGFFVPDPKRSSTSVFSIPLYNVSENVLLRSGLLLAGAGSDTDADRTSAANNGILTGYEVMNIDLSSTDLVVLSACETGLGDIMSGEGVFGLQRAFMIAGAPAVIMSLWKVDDEATRDLMVRFYENWIKSGDLEISFRNAQKSVKERYHHPYYWGSFVLLKN